MRSRTISTPPILLASCVFLLVILSGTLLVSTIRERSGLMEWSPGEEEIIQGLWLGSLLPLPPDPSNRYSENLQAAAFGQKVFFDTRFSINNKVSCAVCHLPELQFQDGTPLAKGVGITNRRTMTIIGTAYSPWFFWDGRKDSQWAQALGPLENPVEHGGDRTFYVHLIEKYYKSEYELTFGLLPQVSHLPEHAGPVADPAVLQAWERMPESDRQNINKVFANVGKAIAAYERLILPGASRFDNYVEALLNQDREGMRSSLSKEEQEGLMLFIGKGECIQCHNGPLFTDNHFHNTGVPETAGLPEDTGRARGASEVLQDEFNCLSVYSDAGPGECAELQFMIAEGDDLIRQFKPPSLRNVAQRDPFMHAGQFATLEAVLAHYNHAPSAPVGHSELKPLGLSEQEIWQIIAFLKSLDGHIAADPQWLQAPELPASNR